MHHKIYDIQLYAWVNNQYGKGKWSLPRPDVLEFFLLLLLFIFQMQAKDLNFDIG